MSHFKGLTQKNVLYLSQSTIYYRNAPSLAISSSFFNRRAQVTTFIPLKVNPSAIDAPMPVRFKSNTVKSRAVDCLGCNQWY